MCLVVTCSIFDLQGQGANPATVTLEGYVDDRFFAVSWVGVASCVCGHLMECVLYVVVSLMMTSDLCSVHCHVTGAI